MALTQVNAAGIKDDAVTAAKIADDAVTEALISDDSVDEPRLKISNAGSNGEFLSKQSGNTGGLTWAAIPAGVGGATGVDFNDSVKARFGTDDDLEIYHDDSNAYLKNSKGNIAIEGKAGEMSVKCIPDGAVELYHNDAKKFETKSDGVLVAGEVQSDTLDCNGNAHIDGTCTVTNAIYQGDGVYHNWGTGNDQAIYHDGGNGYIKNGTGRLHIGCDDLGLLNHATNAFYLQGVAAGAVDLYYNGVKKFETQNTGCKVGGNLTVDGDILPNSTNSDDLGTSSLRFQECHSAYWIHRYGSSGGVTQNEQEAIYIAGGIHFFGDYITMSNSNFSNGICGNRSYPMLAVHQDGSGAAIHAEDGAITEASDYRIKENVATLGSGINKVKALKPITYTLKKSWKPNGNGEVYHGFIAHEVSETLSGITGIVCGEKDAMAPELYSIQDEKDGKIPEGKKVMDETGNMTTDMMIQSVDYGKLTPILTAALKEAITKIETLEAKVAALEAG